MIDSSVARRYAKALLDIGVAKGAADVYADDLAKVAAAIRQSRDLQIALENPVFPVAQRRAALLAVAEQLGVAPVVRTFLSLLVDRSRVAQLDAIARAYRAMADQAAGRVRGEIVTARVLAEDVATKLRAALEQSTGKKVQLERKMDANLLGGAQLKIGSTLFDGSVRARLDEIGERLLRE